MSFMPEKLRKRKEPQEPLIPVGFLAQLLDDDPSLPMPDAILGMSEQEVAEELRWATPSELEAERLAMPMPNVEELLKDPNVAAVVEASALMVPLSE